MLYRTVSKLRPATIRRFGVEYPGHCNGLRSEDRCRVGIARAGGFVGLFLCSKKEGRPEGGKSPALPDTGGEVNEFRRRAPRRFVGLR